MPMMPTMQEIDELTREWFLGPISDEDFAKLCAAARRGVEENSAQDELNRIVDYIMGYWPAGFCYSHPLQAVTVLAGEMQRTQQRAEQLEAELAAIKVERDEAVRGEREALIKYGRHLTDCMGGISGRECTCGLDRRTQDSIRARNQGDSNEH